MTLLAHGPWTRHGEILLPDQAWWEYDTDGTGPMAESSLMYDQGLWKMWYTGYGGIGYATAPSPLGPWTKWGDGPEGVALPAVVANAGFETDTNADGLADNWAMLENVGGTPTTTIVAGRTGGSAQRLQYTAQAGDTGKYIWLYQVVPAGISRYHSSFVDFYAKGSLSGGCTLKTEQVLAGSNEVCTSAFTPNADWTAVQAVGKSFAAGATGNIELRLFRVYFASDVGSVDITVDDVTVGVAHANPVKAWRAMSSVVKYENVYHLWCSDLANIYHCTSTNGIEWGAEDMALAGGAVDDWDHGPANTYPWQDTDDTWYLFYDANKTGTSYSIGVATAAAITGPWTKYAGNPIINRAVTTGGMCVLREGGVNYMWFHGDDPLDPGHGDDIWRANSTDLFNWTVETPEEMTRLGVDEGENVDAGQIADPAVVASGSSFFMFYTADRHYDYHSGLMRLKVASAPRVEVETFADRYITVEAAPMLEDISCVEDDDLSIHFEFLDYDLTGCDASFRVGTPDAEALFEYTIAGGGIQFDLQDPTKLVVTLLGTDTTSRRGFYSWQLRLTTAAGTYSTAEESVVVRGRFRIEGAVL